MAYKRAYINPRKRYTIKKLYNFECYICKKKKMSEELEIDHKIPLIDGGTNDYSNLAPVCIECHLKKTGAEMEKIDGINQNEEISVEKKLKLLKEFLKSNLDKTVPEITFMVINHPLFSKYVYNSSIIANLFNEARGINKKKVNDKYKIQRDCLVYLYKKDTKKSYRTIEKNLSLHGIKLTFQQLKNIVTSFQKKIIKSHSTESSCLDKSDESCSVALSPNLEQI